MSDTIAHLIRNQPLSRRLTRRALSESIEILGTYWYVAALIWMLLSSAWAPDSDIRVRATAAARLDRVRFMAILRKVVGLKNCSTPPLGTGFSG